MYYVYKFIRRKARLVASKWATMETEVQVWPSITQSWTTWLRELAQADRRTTRHTFARPRGVTVTAFSDASDVGLGSIIFWPDGRISSWARPYTRPPPHINIAELWAARDTLRAIAQHAEERGLRVETIVLYVDNTTASAWLKAGTSRTYLAAQLLCELPQILRGCHLEVLYVPSAAQLADGPSRATQPVVIHYTPAAGTYVRVGAPNETTLRA